MDRNFSMCLLIIWYVFLTTTVYIIWQKKRLKDSENAFKFDTCEMINLDILLFKKHN